LSGEDKPKDESEAIGFAESVFGRQSDMPHRPECTRIFAVHPKVSDDLNSGNRYNAACAAALAGSGKDKEVPPLDDAARVNWRTKAREWLRADLTAWNKRMDGPAEGREPIATALAHWKVDTDLAAIRDPEALAKLPEAERDECTGCGRCQCPAQAGDREVTVIK